MGENYMYDLKIQDFASIPIDACPLLKRNLKSIMTPHPENGSQHGE